MDNNIYIYIYKYAKRIINQLINAGKKEFVIYPFGGCGRELKKLLNDHFHIKEKYVIDNNIHGNLEADNLYSVGDIRNLDIKNATILLCHYNPLSYNEIRNQIYNVVDEAQVVDLLSFSMYYDSGIYYEQTHFEDIKVAHLELAAREIYFNNVSGAVAECGVYRGGFAKWIARFMPDRKLYLFDTFEGFDNRDIDEKEEFYTGAFRRIYKFDDTSVDIVLKNIGEYRDTVVRKGYFPDTALGLENERFAFVSLDTDLYKPILAGLEFFYPRLNPGGYIFVDDYGQIEGVRQAVLEYSQANGCGYMRLSDNTRTAVVVKPLGR